MLDNSTNPESKRVGSFGDVLFSIKIPSPNNRIHTLQAELILSLAVLQGKEALLIT